MEKTLTLLLICLLLAPAVLGQSRKQPKGLATYDQYEKESVAAYRSRASFSYPAPPPLQPAPQPQGPRLRPVLPYFAPGSSLLMQAEPRLDILLSRHIEINSQTLHVEGFRIQVYQGANRQLAQENKQNAASQFPDQPSYLDFASPNWTVRIGDFSDKESATVFLKKIREFFPSAYLVPDQVFLQRSPGREVPAGEEEEKRR
jgi:hypothetical protein